MNEATKNEHLAALVKQLPRKLRTTVRTDVLNAAVQQGVLCICEDGHWQWQQGNKTLLAYFCGRMWCGDSPIYNKNARGYVWQGGSARFPEKALNTLFGEHNLRTLREQRKALGALPTDWTSIEKFFK